LRAIAGDEAAQRAARELDDISRYFLEHNPTAGVGFIAALEVLLDHLAIMPALGRPTSVANVRVLIVPRYPYRIFYLPEGDAISILSVFHAARDPGAAPAD